jgi:hypothetical protein
MKLKFYVMGPKYNPSRIRQSKSIGMWQLTSQFLTEIKHIMIEFIWGIMNLTKWKELRETSKVHIIKTIWSWSHIEITKRSWKNFSDQEKRLRKRQEICTLLKIWKGKKKRNEIYVTIQKKTIRWFFILILDHIHQINLVITNWLCCLKKEKVVSSWDLIKTLMENLINKLGLKIKNL